MNQQEIAYCRLNNQHLTDAPFAQAVDVVRWHGAVQAQDFPAAKWAVGQRTAGLTDADVQQAVDDGAILRTHVLRPTWHFVAPDDIRWMLKLTAPRVKTAIGTALRQLELDAVTLARTNDILAKALESGRQLTRKELAEVLEAAGIVVGDLHRIAFIIANAELDGVICSGAYRGKQLTYALLEERVPYAHPLERGEALAELALRYFTSHAPATLRDYVWWSGLTVADARAGLEMIKAQLVGEVVDGVEYWLPPSATPVMDVSRAYLLPNYDEYLIAYADRSAMADPAHNAHPAMRGSAIFNHTIIVSGQVVGIWKRAVKKSAVIIEPTFFRPLSAAEEAAFCAAAQRYGAFVGLPVVVQ